LAPPHDAARTPLIDSAILSYFHAKKVKEMWRRERGIKQVVDEPVLPFRNY
jgi:hypothetical protein